ncbi:MAG: hypothetical protein HRF49_07680 [bacterium]|jgi:predicted PurR-regulated permease PerM
MDSTAILIGAISALVVAVIGALGKQALTILREIFKSQRESNAELANIVAEVRKLSNGELLKNRHETLKNREILTQIAASLDGVTSSLESAAISRAETAKVNLQILSAVRGSAAFKAHEGTERRTQCGQEVMTQ